VCVRGWKFVLRYARQQRQWGWKFRNAMARPAHSPPAQCRRGRQCMKKQRGRGRRQEGKKAAMAMVILVMSVYGGGTQSCPRR